MTFASALLLGPIGLASYLASGSIDDAAAGAQEGLLTVVAALVLFVLFAVVVVLGSVYVLVRSGFIGAVFGFIPDYFRAMGEFVKDVLSGIGSLAP